MLFNESLDGGAAVPCFAVRRLSTRLQNSADKMAEGRGQSQLAGTLQWAASSFKLLETFAEWNDSAHPTQASRPGDALVETFDRGLSRTKPTNSPPALVLSTAAAKLKTVRVSNPDVVI